MRKQESTDRLWFRPVVLRCTALHRLDSSTVKEHTAAVPRKGWETDDFGHARRMLSDGGE